MFCRSLFVLFCTGEVRFVWTLNITSLFELTIASCICTTWTYLRQICFTVWRKSCSKAFWLAREKSGCHERSSFRVPRSETSSNRNFQLRWRSNIAVWDSFKKDDQLVRQVSDERDIQFRFVILRIIVICESNGARSEKSIDKLIKLRESSMQHYKDSKIPTEWMLQSGVISKVRS